MSEIIRDRTALCGQYNSSVEDINHYFLFMNNSEMRFDTKHDLLIFPSLHITSLYFKEEDKMRSTIQNSVRQTKYHIGIDIVYFDTYVDIWKSLIN